MQFPENLQKPLENIRKSAFLVMGSNTQTRKTQADYSYRKSLEIQGKNSFGAIGEIYWINVSSVNCWETMGKHVFLSGPAKKLRSMNLL